MTLKSVENNFVRSFPPAPLPMIPGESNANSSQSTVGPLMAAAQTRQSQLLVEDTINEARTALRAATDLVINRGWATSDTFVRHHLLSAAREIAAISVSLNASVEHGESATPCLVRVVDHEIASVAACFPDRAGQISRGVISLDVLPSWTSVFIFGLVVRTLLNDAVHHTTPGTRLSVRFRQDREMLRFGIDGAGHCSESELLSRIPDPKRFRSLIASLSGRVESAPNGISIRMPVIACASIEFLQY